jgi:hypothetical protein
MSLQHAAQHLASQGRGPDTMLVHMAPNEVNALNQFAKQNGTHLTVNPQTGLPEAGLLSMLIGGATAIFAPHLLPYVAGGLGVAKTAMSGSLGEGIMTGLSAWSGGQLAGSIQNLAQTGAEKLGTEAFKETAQKAAESTVGGAGEIGMANAFPNALSGTTSGIGAGVDAGIASIPTTAREVGMANSFNPIMGGSAFPQNYASPFSGFDAGQGFNKFASGAEQLVKSPIESVGKIWDMPGGKSSLIGAGMNIFQALQPGPYKTPEEEEDNPMGFKKLSKDFKGTFPEQPKPAYQAQYRDYVTNPYMTYPAYAAQGGLQTANYASGDLVKYGLSLLEQPKSKGAPIMPRDPGDAYGGPGVIDYEKEYEGMSPLERTHAKMQALFGKKNAIRSMGSLGAISTDPAIVAMQSIEDEKQKKAQSAKEGGLQGYALGGLSMGNLGGYSDGGRLLKGPGDGVSDSIPASIGSKQPARLAEGEFVIPARIVSELGNGSTDAGAKRLYAMMDRIKAKRSKTKNIAADSKAYKLLPA